MPSKTKIDQLGDRLRAGSPSEEDLRLLDEYRLSFSEAYNRVMDELRTRLKTKPSGRSAKSTQSIIDKLRRESIRLTQIQDIAGCRVVVPGIDEQDHMAREIRQIFSNTRLVDRREQPQHGYRAIHLIVTSTGLPVEIQVRTSFQQVWAELSEKASDVVDPEIKYGGGLREIRDLLNNFSDMIMRREDQERRWRSVRSRIEGEPEFRIEIHNVDQSIQDWTRLLENVASDLNKWLEAIKSRKSRNRESEGT